MIIFIKNKVKLFDIVLNENMNLLEMKECAISLLNYQKDKIYISFENLDKNLHKQMLYILDKYIYTFEKYKTNVQNKNQKEVYVYLQNKEILEKLRYIKIARDLANEPGNIIYPETFCNIVRKLFKHNKNTHIKIFSQESLIKMGMNLINAVGKGSTHPPQMVIVEIDNKSKKNVVLVGKGITFDSGGYDIKPGKYMEGMHGDKTGGSIVISLLKYLADHGNKKYNYYGVVPLAENMVSGKAYKIGDIFKAYNGKTVEIRDTDCEGRNVLADALSYACEYYNPHLLIDVATLTGWASLLHCDINFNYFTMNDGLSNKIQKLESGERSIRLPSWLEYRKFTKSKVADYMNGNYQDCSNNEGFMATMFLSNFIPDKYIKNWIHIDIAHHETNHYINCNSISSLIELLS